VTQNNGIKWQNTGKKSTAKEERPSRTLVAISGQDKGIKRCRRGNGQRYLPNTLPQPKDPGPDNAAARQGLIQDESKHKQVQLFAKKTKDMENGYGRRTKTNGRRPNDPVMGVHTSSNDSQRDVRGRQRTGEEHSCSVT